jgi:hypothetical protein
MPEPQQHEHKTPKIVRPEEAKTQPGKDKPTCEHCDQPVGEPHGVNCKLAY